MTYVGYYIPSQTSVKWLSKVAKTDRFRGDRLRQIREEKQLTQRELARACGLGENLIYRYENKLSDPTIGTLVEIAEYLDTTSDYLLGLTLNPDKTRMSVDLDTVEEEIISVYRREGWSGVARVSVEHLSK